VMDIPLQNTQREIGLTMRAGSTPSPAARAMIDAIRLTVDQLRHQMRRESGAIRSIVL
jgi:LysR family transcriptional regulator, regulator for genes of the gallate degradation pathway